jgi:hypothetical protein
MWYNVGVLIGACTVRFNSGINAVADLR